MVTSITEAPAPLRSSAREYRGRFAPSPTGPLHFGSLVAAAGSYLDARSSDGKWMVRVEDLDRSREMPGATDAILSALDAFGFEWDEEVVYQSRRIDLYRAAFERLERIHAVYPCACTRREIADSTLSPQGESIYPGTCRDGLPPGRSARAMRLRVSSSTIAFDDRLQGVVRQNLASDSGDFVLRRADGLFAYQLAVVIDDAEQNISDVVRGADLLASTPRQIFLQHLLNVSTPRYLHLPVAVNSRGEKLSKQTRASALDPTRAVPTLWRALSFLNQNPPRELVRTDLSELWIWAIAHWNAGNISRQKILPAGKANEIS